MAESNVADAATADGEGTGRSGTAGDTLELKDLLQTDDSDPSSVSSNLQFSYDAEAGAIRVDITSSSGTHKQSISVPGADVTAGGVLSDSQIIQMLLAQGKPTQDI